MKKLGNMLDCLVQNGEGGMASPNLLQFEGFSKYFYYNPDTEPRTKGLALIEIYHSFNTIDLEQFIIKELSK